MIAFTHKSQVTSHKSQVTSVVVKLRTILKLALFRLIWCDLKEIGIEEEQQDALGFLSRGLQQEMHPFGGLLSCHPVIEFGFALSRGVRCGLGVTSGLIVIQKRLEE
ncbi:hypothetical protein K2173_006511 [Erythroxylum novogranatense]|uniref:Uncharacterized protein n=1 Tax=Erythroxylum novogranatense TaxID=1862640 RepID=A0AAV8T754_9ROSI|nr:hypothetical protein K2173_006511 [Erythroxylum novogranatense]